MLVADRPQLRVVGEHGVVRAAVGIRAVHAMRHGGAAALDAMVPWTIPLLSRKMIFTQARKVVHLGTGLIVAHQQFPVVVTPAVEWLCVKFVH